MDTSLDQHLEMKRTGIVSTPRMMMTMTVCHIMSQVPIVWLTTASMIMISMREIEKRKEEESKQRRS